MLEVWEAFGGKVRAYLLGSTACAACALGSRVDYGHLLVNTVVTLCAYIRAACRSR